MRRFRFVRSPLRIVPVVFILALAGTASAGDASPPRPSQGEVDQTAELERALAPLFGEDVEARRAAAIGVEKMGPDAVPAIAKRLAEERKASKDTVVAAIKAARDATAKADRADLDLEDALLKTKSDGGGWRTAITTVVLVRTLAHVGTTAAVRPMVKVALDHGGAFRPEIARQIKTLGDKAVPALIETRKESSSELRHWSFSQLEGMGKRVPGDAVQTKDNQVLADVLHAFAAVHDLDALPVILSFVNSDRIQIRSAARDALADFGQDAIWKLREALANVTGKPAPEGLPAADVRKELFAAYDRLRLQEVYGLLDEGLARMQEGKAEEATLAFDKVLARQPMIERRPEMVPAYLAYAAAASQEGTPDGRAKALALYRKALRLWPEVPRRPQIEAEIAYLEGEDLLARGIVDTEPFERALRLDPTHQGARAELTRLETNVEEREQRIRGFAAAAAVVVVGLLGIILFGGGSARRRLRQSA